MFDFGKGKRIQALEDEIDELAISVEEAEVTVQTKDNIIKKLLKDKQLDKKEIEQVEQEIRIYKARIAVEEKRYRLYLKNEAKRNPEMFLAKRRRSTIKIPPEALIGRITITCIGINIESQRSYLKARQGGKTLPGGKTAVVHRPLSPVWEPLILKLLDIDSDQTLDFEVWSKGMISSSCVGYTRLALSDLVRLHKEKKSDVRGLVDRRGRELRVRVRETRTGKIKHVQQKIAIQSVRIAALPLSKPGSNTASGGVPAPTTPHTTTATNDSNNHNNQTPHKGGAHNVKPIPPTATPVSMTGVTLNTLVGRWVSSRGGYFFVTPGGRALDAHKRPFGQISIAPDKIDYDLGMVNHDKKEAWIFAKKVGQNLNWSTEEVWKWHDNTIVVRDSTVEDRR